jgi:hypothetical protein
MPDVNRRLAEEASGFSVAYPEPLFPLNVVGNIGER